MLVALVQTNLGETEKGHSSTQGHTTALGSELESQKDLQDHNKPLL